MAVKARQPAQVALFVLGIVLAGGGIWSFLRFLKVADTHQRLISLEATSFAFVASLLLTLQSASCNDSGSFLGPRSWYPH